MTLMSFQASAKTDIPSATLLLAVHLRVGQRMSECVKSAQLVLPVNPIVVDVRAAMLGGVRSHWQCRHGQIPRLYKQTYVSRQFPTRLQLPAFAPSLQPLHDSPSIGYIRLTLLC